MEATTLILSILLSPCMMFDTNWGHLPPITSSGIPCSFQMPSQNNWATPSEVMLDVVVMKWAHLDNYKRSTVTSMEL